MTNRLRTLLIGFACVVIFGTGGWTLGAAAEAAPAQTKSAPKKGTEAHPLLTNSIRQIEAIKDRLQKAPTDFGGHKEAAIDALNRADNELHQAIQFDKWMPVQLLEECCSAGETASN